MVGLVLFTWCVRVRVVLLCVRVVRVVRVPRGVLLTPSMLGIACTMHTNTFSV